MERKWRYGFAILIAVVAVLWPWWYFCRDETVVLLVRHADRAGSTDALTASGIVRAQELVHVMEKAALNAIVRSDAVRAQQTAAPVAAATGLTPVVIPAANVQAFVDEIRNNQRGRRVLVVGHSDTVPAIIAALGGPTLPVIPAGEFDNLFALTLCSCRWSPARLVNLQYGAVSP